MPSRTVYIRRSVLNKLIKMAKELGYVENGVVKWHSLLNDLLEAVIAMYEAGRLNISKKRVM